MVLTEISHVNVVVFCERSVVSVTIPHFKDHLLRSFMANKTSAISRQLDFHVCATINNFLISTNWFVVDNEQHRNVYYVFLN